MLIPRVLIAFAYYCSTSDWDIYKSIDTPKYGYSNGVTILIVIMPPLAGQDSIVPSQWNITRLSFSPQERWEGEGRR